MAATSCCSNLLLISSVLVASFFCVSSANVEGPPPETTVPLTQGLSWQFYAQSCPDVEFIVRAELMKIFRADIAQAAGLLRLHFHDCFVQGCDGSVLLDGSASGPSEKNAPPNLTLRAKAFKIINDLRALIHNKCGRVVSCSDITALAARDAVFMSGGPFYAVPLGRRDGLNFATLQVTLANLPPPSSSASAIVGQLATNQKLNPTDVVALSGAHTIGIAHCPSFGDRLYPNQDPSMDPNFANKLKAVCPKKDTDAFTFQDILTPNIFDNKYYVDLMNRQGLFTSDQDLFTFSGTKEIVRSFAINQSLFFEKFVIAMTKMGQLNVLTGNQGEIRANCSARNPQKKVFLASVVENGEIMTDF
ncbi:peroxidase 12-like [Humulus lupulus]|uniref:peroxidase 12-like n=1 Tax=Humulus lupulus TaxID=3486 RepID=UPI002B40BD61|nr:peroxidase 12-like [Humulus lupulus]